MNHHRPNTSPHTGKHNMNRARRLPCCPLLVTHWVPHQYTNYLDFQQHKLVLLVSELYGDGIIHYVQFCVSLLSVKIIFVRLSVLCIFVLQVFWMLGIIPVCICSTFYLSCWCQQVLVWALINSECHYEHSRTCLLLHTGMHFCRVFPQKSNCSVTNYQNVQL